MDCGSSVGTRASSAHLASARGAEDGRNLARGESRRDVIQDDPLLVLEQTSTSSFPRERDIAELRQGVKTPLTGLRVKTHLDVDPVPNHMTVRHVGGFASVLGIDLCCVLLESAGLVTGNQCWNLAFMPGTGNTWVDQYHHGGVS